MALAVSELDNSALVQREVAAWKENRDDLLDCSYLHGFWRKEFCQQRQEELRHYFKSKDGGSEMRDGSFISSDFCVCKVNGCPHFTLDGVPDKSLPLNIRGRRVTEKGLKKQKMRAWREREVKAKGLEKLIEAGRTRPEMAEKFRT